MLGIAYVLLLIFYIVLLAWIGVVNIAAIAGYVLQGYALQRIATRRGINKPWLAWIPVAQSFMLGKVADNYRQKVLGKKSKKAKLLTISHIAWLAWSVIEWLICMVGAVCVAIVGTYIPDAEVLIAIPAILYGIVCWVNVFIIMALAMLYTVLMFLALNDVYASCDPKNKKLYLILSIAVEVVIGLPARAVFLMLSMNKDGGMIPSGGSRGRS